MGRICQTVDVINLISLFFYAIAKNYAGAFTGENLALLFSVILSIVKIGILEFNCFLDGRPRPSLEITFFGFWNFLKRDFFVLLTLTLYSLGIEILVLDKLFRKLLSFLLTRGKVFPKNLF